MHSISRSLPIKGPIKHISRWHPYHQQHPSASAAESSPHAFPFKKKCTISSTIYVNTPVSMVSSSSSDDRSSFSQGSGQITSISAPLERDQSSFSSAASALERQQHATDLIEQAVKLLSDAWSPVANCPFPQTLAVPNCQWSSRRQASPSYLPSPPTPSHSPSASPQFEGNSTGQYPFQSTAEHMPLHNFVHALIRRSRTSCATLQTALCYVEAVSCKLPALLGEEVNRIDSLNASIFLKDDDEPSPIDLIVEATSLDTPPDDVGVDAFSLDSAMDSASQAPATPESMKSKKKRAPCKALAPLPSLPSPLLCPRRTFLASLLVATKFLQDRAFSNKAWAKLTGLSPREIGRCERALLQVLDWRLWVGKGSVDNSLRPEGIDDGAALSFVQSHGSTLSHRSLSTTSLTQVASRYTSAPSACGDAIRSRRLSKCKSDGALIVQLKRKMALAALSSTDLRLQGNLSSDTIPSLLRSPPQLERQDFSNGSQLPLPTAYGLPQLSRTSTLFESGSLSTPGSLLDTQSSLSSFASFPEIFTPPLPLVSQMELSVLGPKVSSDTDIANQILGMSVDEIVGRS